MGDEIHNLLIVCISVWTSLVYCYTIGKIISRGTTRLLFIFPVISLFLALPLKLSSIHLRVAASFCITWLANSKLALFSYGEGPLAPSMSLSHFILLASLPIKIQQNPSRQIPLLNYVIKVVIICVAVQLQAYEYKEYIHLKNFLFSLYVFLGLEIGLVLIASPGRVIFSGLEPQFNEPCLSTSVQDFWGKRWNLMASSILRTTVYLPVRSAFSHLIGRKWAAYPGMLATFLVSALMHELLFFYVGGVKTTWEVTCFFFLHGVWVCVEIGVKKKFGGKFLLPRPISWLLTLVFMAFTSFWWFFPPLLRGNVDIKVRTEVIALFEYVEYIGRYFN